MDTILFTHFATLKPHCNGWLHNTLVTYFVEVGEISRKEKHRLTCCVDLGMVAKVSSLS